MTLVQKREREIGALTSPLFECRLVYHDVNVVGRIILSCANIGERQKGFNERDHHRRREVKFKLHARPMDEFIER